MEKTAEGEMTTPYLSIITAADRMGWHIHSMYLFAMRFLAERELEALWRADLESLALLEGWNPRDARLDTATKTNLVCAFIEAHGESKAFAEFLGRLERDWQTGIAS